LTDWALVGQGREAEVFLRPDGKVVKVVRDPSFAPRLDREIAAIGALRGGGVAAPETHGIVDVDGRAGLVLDRIDGTDLLSRLNANPLRMFRAATVMANEHAAMHECQAPDVLPMLNEELHWRIATTESLPKHLADLALATLDDLPQGDRLCHGDFHLGNILGTWEAPVAIDWGDASRGDPLADVARTRLLHRVGELPPGSSRLLRVFAKVGRGLLVARYLTAYNRLHLIDHPLLDRWEIVRAAARFHEGIEREFPALTQFLEKAKSKA
jgi:aminoglycoside phosphotransferase (APT) family kinase protein